MKTLLENSIAAALKSWRPENTPEVAIHIERTRDPKHGDFACNIAMLLAKICQRKPMEIAQEIVAHIPPTSQIAEVNIAAPGFINFTLHASAFHAVLQEVLAQTTEYGRLTLGQGKRIHAEFVSSNPTGPLHVGHGRHAAYGASLCNVLEAAGYSVHREYYVNDAGRQMRILALSVWLRYLEISGETMAPFPRRGYKGSYVVDIAEALKAKYGTDFFKSAAEVMQDLPPDDKEQEEQYIDALVARAEKVLGKSTFDVVFQYALNTILQDMQNDLEEFGVTYHHWFHESSLFESGEVTRTIEALDAGGFLYKKEGATWFRSSQFGDEKDRVVVRENGQPTYFASDIAYHLHKYASGFDRIIGVYGSDHHGYTPRINASLQALKQDVSKLEILLVQFAILYRGEARASMSTRGGDFVTLRALRAEVGNDAARFFYIMRKHEQHLDFDLELAKSTSNDNPVYYIQYAHARICSVFRQLAQKSWTWNALLGSENLHQLDTLHEKALLRCLSRYPEVIALVAETCEPATLAYYLQEVANLFHAYYNAAVFLVEDQMLRDARLCLITATRHVLENGLALLGVSAPEAM
jgi:arginyl-tRNA synthetase